MGADEVADCPHDWWLSRMVLDGKGTLLVDRCRVCGAIAVTPASGDRGEVSHGPDGV